MGSFIVILENILMLMIMMAIGFVSEKTGYIKDIKEKVSHVILRITLPLLVITSITSRTLDINTLKQAGMVTLVALLVIITMCVLSILVAKIFKLDGPARAMHTICSMFGNVGFLGYPLISAVCGQEAMVYAVFFGFANDLLLYSFGIMLASGERRPQLKKLINPNTISLVIGVLMAAFGLSLPDILHNTFTLVGDATIPLSMLFIGATLAGASIKQIIGRPTVYILTFIKMVFVPLCLIFIFKHTSFLDKLAEMVVILQTAVSCATTSAIFAKEYGSDIKYATSAIFITTISSLITLPIIYTIAQRLL